MTAPIIIGISGYARAGKDTAAEPLIDVHGFEKLAYADGVRELAAQLNPLIDFYGEEPGRLVRGRGIRIRYVKALETFGYEYLKAHSSIRDELVKIGAGVRNVIGPDSWVKAVEHKIQPGGSYVIPDVRYANEVEMVHRLGGVVWAIERPGVGPANEEEARSFESVYGDSYFSNSGTPEDLHSLVHAAIDKHYRRLGGTGFAWEHPDDAGME